MNGHTLVNLRELEDMAQRFGLAPDLQARFATHPLGMERGGLSVQRLAPGARMPFGHRHREQEEVYVVLAGSGRMALDDRVIEVGPLDAVRVAGPVARSFEAGPEGLEWIVFGAPLMGAPPGDTEQLPGWWPEG